MNARLDNRDKLRSDQRWVIKIGSNLLTNEGRTLRDTAIKCWVKQLAHLHQSGLDIVLVSSGAVAVGMLRMHALQRPKKLSELQAMAAIGQMGLVHQYESLFYQHQIKTAQVLLTHDDLSDRKRYLNARNTLSELLKVKVIPIINENDTVATDEIRFGDNDRLAALVANLLEADSLIILTDQAGVFDQDPRLHHQATLIRETRANDHFLNQAAGGSTGRVGTGGMRSKIEAARLAARSGAFTLIADGNHPDCLLKIRQAEPSLGTLLTPDQEKLAARKQWLAGHLQMKGQIHIDQGAANRLKQHGSSLLAVGITHTDGQFQQGDMVSCVDPQGVKVACGLCNFNAQKVRRISGLSSQEILAQLPDIDALEVIHRDNMVIF